MAQQVAAHDNVFLLPAGLPQSTLRQVSYLASGNAAIEQGAVSFPEGGGAVDLELAVPFVAGMDEVTVDAAQLVLRATDQELSSTEWQAQPGPSGHGAFVVLDAPSRLRRVVIAEPAPTPGGFLVIRAASRTGGGAAVPGAPLFADWAYDPGPMLPAPLAGLAVGGHGSGRLTLSIPATSGQAWLVQLASGDDLAELAPVAAAVTILAVTVLPAAEDVELVLLAGDGAPQQPLWQHPGAVLPGAGEQLADFTPAAGRRLALALTALNAAGATAATLSLPLRFTATGAGELAVPRRALDVRYLSYPLGRDPLPVVLDGGWTEIVLDAPPRIPVTSELRLTGRHRGLAVNRGSGVPLSGIPAGGLRVRAERTVAVPVRWLPGVDGASPSLAEVRLFGAAVGDTEVVCEVRADAAGAPGPALCAPLVARLPAGSTPRWLALPLPAATPLPGPATIWVTARTNRGELAWYTVDGVTAFPAGSESSDAPPDGFGLAAPRVSSDGGTSWGDADTHLRATGSPVVALLEAVDPAQRPPPAISVRLDGAEPTQLVLTPGAVPGEYAEPAPAVLPPAIVAAIGRPGPSDDGSGRRRSVAALWSADLVDLTVTRLVCSYAAQARGPRPVS